MCRCFTFTAQRYGKNKRPVHGLRKGLLDRPRAPDSESVDHRGNILLMEEKPHGEFGKLVRRGQIKNTESASSPHQDYRRYGLIKSRMVQTKPKELKAHLRATATTFPRPYYSRQAKQS